MATDKTKSTWLNLINIDNVDSAERQRRSFTFFTMIIIALILITSLLFINYQIYAVLLSHMLILSAISMLVCSIYFYKTGRILLVGFLVLMIINFLNIVLVYTGGKENTALYWLMFYPIVAFSILGYKLGIIAVLLLLTSVSILFFGADIGQVVYSNAEKIRFIASFSVVVLFSFINEFYRHKSYQKIAQMTLLQKRDAYSDQLTGLANRRFINNHFIPLVKSRPAHYLPMSILLIDLDHFKTINDQYGHDCGDYILKIFSDILEQQLHDTAIKARYGGEEFVIILPQHNCQSALGVANKLRQYIEQQTLSFSNYTLKITCSIGVAQVNQIENFSNAIKVADTFLYKAKHAGRNCVKAPLEDDLIYDFQI